MAFKKVFGVNELSEIANEPAGKYILKNWDRYKHQFPINEENDYDYNPKTILTKYLAGYKKTLPVKYNKSSKYPSKVGRWFCKGGIGIQSLPRALRHTLCKGLYIDLDFKNCHPVILKTLCEKHNICCKYLSHYVDNREELLNKWSISLNMAKDDIKKIVLCALNGNTTEYNIPNWNEVLSEFNVIHRTISALPEYKTLLEEVEKINIKNIYAKTVNRILCNIENKCLETLFINLDKRELLNVYIDDVVYKVCSLIFDGAQIPDNEKTRLYINEDNLALLSAVIHNDTEFKLSIIVKEFDEAIELPLNYEDEVESKEEYFIEDDGDACDVILRLYGDLLVNCNDVKYIKKGDIWYSGDKVVYSTIYNWIYDTNMKKLVGKEYKYYNRDKTFINKCLDIVMNRGFKDNKPDFIKGNLIKSKNYLPFLNGVYSFKEKKLLAYSKVPVDFTMQIERNFPEYNKDAYDELMEKIIKPILPNEEEREYFMYILSRALSGNYEDKKWFINKGSRNSGKGVITKLLQNAFKSYVGIFNSGAFVYKKNENADDAKNLSWVVMVKDKRLIISNEFKENENMNGILVKSFSGADSVVGRTNHKDEMTFDPQFMMLFMCNNLKGVEPPDALENCVQFYCKSKFVEKEELIEGQAFLKLRDATIKATIEKSEIIDAFTLYLVSHYADKKVIPECVKTSTNDMKADMPITLEQVMLKHFRYSNNNKDRLFTEDIINNIRKCGYEHGVNTKNLASLMIKCNLSTRTDNGNTSINGKKKSGYENIIYIPPPPPPKDDDNEEENIEGNEEDIIFE